MSDNPEGRAKLLDLLDRALRVKCPTCGLRAGNACLSEEPGIHFHPARLELANRHIFLTPGTEEKPS